ncbi:MAG TPA: hypothetical protein PKA62_16595 [Thermoanaerobaculia bacterium]|nr:hypothetical protein [Thermoanaerobaculia bacterium]
MTPTSKRKALLRDVCQLLLVAGLILTGRSSTRSTTGHPPGRTR